MWHQFLMRALPIGTVFRPKPRCPPMQDRVFNHALNHSLAGVIVPAALPAKAVTQGAGDAGIKRIDLNLCDLGPIPALAEPGPQPPAPECLGALLGKILGKVGGLVVGNSLDVNAAPARALGELAALVDVNPLVS